MEVELAIDLRAAGYGVWLATVPGLGCPCCRAGVHRLRERHAGQRVLLAEDSPVNAEVATELLASVGLVVELADNGLSAMELALTRAYDLVLMDVQMPAIDGLEATRRIRQQHRQGLPIVATTANAFGEDRAACLDAGMNDHIAKPVEVRHLCATPLRWLPLQADASKEQRADWPATAHALRGACGAAGFSALAERLLAFERASTGGGEASDLSAEAQAVDAELREAAATLRRALGS